MSQEDLLEIQLQIDNANAETQRLMEKKVTGESNQENLTLFRQQASRILHKKEARDPVTNR